MKAKLVVRKYCSAGDYRFADIVVRAYMTGSYGTALQPRADIICMPGRQTKHFSNKDPAFLAHDIARRTNKLLQPNKTILFHNELPEHTPNHHGLAKQFQDIFMHDIEALTLSEQKAEEEAMPKPHGKAFEKYLDEMKRKIFE